MHIYIPIVLLGITLLSGVGSYAFMTYKLREHQANGNEEYAKDVAKARVQFTALFGLFLFIQLLGLVSRLLH